jgi:hypothetical protein
MSDGTVHTTNQKVLIWARGKTGKQVGRGECWDLADRALHQAGAASSTTTGKDDDYEWGDAVALKDIAPGDILQFRDYDVTTTIETKTSFEDGSGSTATTEKTAVRGHHTAIVDTVSPGAVVVLEQHVKPLGKRVQRHTIPLRDASSVTTSVKHVKKGGRTQSVKTITKTTVTVSGKIWAYHPKK